MIQYRQPSHVSAGRQGTPWPWLLPLDGLITMPQRDCPTVILRLQRNTPVSKTAKVRVESGESVDNVNLTCSASAHGAPYAAAKFFLSA